MMELVTNEGFISPSSRQQKTKERNQESIECNWFDEGYR